MSDELKLICVYCKGEHATVDCPKWESQSELVPALGSTEPDLKMADTHLDLAEIALSAAFKNGRGINVVVRHLEDAIKALRPVKHNDQAHL